MSRPVSVIQAGLPQGEPSEHVELAAHRVLREYRPSQRDVPLVKQKDKGGK